MLISDRQYVYEGIANFQFYYDNKSISDLIILGYKYLWKSLHANIEYFAHELMASFLDL
jgi:hypothetical protein